MQCNPIPIAPTMMPPASSKKGGGDVWYLEWQNFMRRKFGANLKYHCKIWYKIPSLWHRNKHAPRMWLLAACCHSLCPSCSSHRLPRIQMGSYSPRTPFVRAHRHQRLGRSSATWPPMAVCPHNLALMFLPTHDLFHGGCSAAILKNTPFPTFAPTFCTCVMWGGKPQVQNFVILSLFRMSWRFQLKLCNF